MKYESEFNKTSPQKIIRLGARGSMLSRWQADCVAKQIEKAWPDCRVETQILRTSGDELANVPLPEIGGKGVFTAEIEKALLAGDIDIAVHSQKDLPVDDSPGLTIGAVIEREDPRDALVSRHGNSLSTLPKGARVGTSSTRRAAQLRFNRPDLVPVHIRGNVDTRIAKALDAEGQYDATVLAYAGLLRIGRADAAADVISVELMLPAPAQGALAVQCRQDSDVLRIISRINHVETELATLAERSFLKALGGGCSLPVAAFAELAGGLIRLRGNVIAVDGSGKIDIEMEAAIELLSPARAREIAKQIGEKLAVRALERGADKLLLSSKI